MLGKVLIEGIILISYPYPFSLRRGDVVFSPNLCGSHPQELLCDACARLEVAESSDDRELPQAPNPCIQRNGCFQPKIVGVLPPKMDGENNGKAY